MKNKIIAAVFEAEKAGARKIPLGSAEYYAPFESLYENDRENFCAALSEMREDVQTDAKILLHALCLSERFGVKIEALAGDMRGFFEKCFALAASRDVWSSREGFFLTLKAEELLRRFAGGTYRSYFENFISLSEVADLQTAGLYDLCAELRLVKPTPKYIKDAMRASGIIDGLYSTVPWQYYLEHTSLAKIGRDIAALEKAGFAKIPSLLGDILGKMKEAEFASRKQKARFCEKICLKNKDFIKEIMEDEENIIDNYIISQNLLKK